MNPIPNFSYHGICKPREFELCLVRSTDLLFCLVGRRWYANNVAHRISATATLTRMAASDATALPNDAA